MRFSPQGVEQQNLAQSLDSWMRLSISDIIRLSRCQATTYQMTFFFKVLHTYNTLKASHSLNFHHIYTHTVELFIIP